MYDGIIRIFFDIQHILNLKENMISLNTLDSQDFKYSSEGEVLKVSNNVLIMLKNRLSHGL